MAADRHLVDGVIFDFDGTLAHTAPAYTRAYREAMLAHTGVEPDEAELEGFINITAEEFSSKFPSLEAMVSFEAYYYASHHESLEVFAGIPELLAALRAEGMPLAIVSLKPRRAGEIEIDLMDLRAPFDCCIWGDDVEVPKPAPDGVLAALARLAVAPSRAIVVGDSASDIAMGRAAGARTAAALWSNPRRDRLGGADVYLDTPADLLREIFRR